MCFIGICSISVCTALSGGGEGDEALTLGLFALRVLVLGVTFSDSIISGSDA